MFCIDLDLQQLSIYKYTEFLHDIVTFSMMHTYSFIKLVITWE